VAKDKTRKSKTQLRILDLETMTIGNLISICYYEKKVVMQSEAYGCTSQKFKKCKLLIDL
jgi:hypothetical protein